MEDNFLEFLIAAFINKKYVFLNSFRLTSQGNIHSLYSLSKRIAFEMEKVLKYSNFKKNFEYWRTFVADSLQLYELKLDSILYKIDYEETPREDEEALVEID